MRILFTLFLLFFCKTAFADVENGKSDLVKVYKYIYIYKNNHAGSSPSSMSELRQDMARNLNLYDYESLEEFSLDLKNEDVSASPKYKIPLFKNFIPYLVTDRRLDGSPLGSPRRKGERDVLSYSDIYLSRISSVAPGRMRLKTLSDWGQWIVLWDDGTVESIPFDLRYLVGNFKDGFRTAFPLQAGVKFDSLSYSEYNSRIPNISLPKPVVKEDKSIVIDNGGPEGLVQLSRRVSYPNLYGIDREQLWKQFDAAQAEFTISNVQSGATQLGLDTQVQKQTLAQLQKSGTPALLFLQDDGRIVALTAIDDDRAVVVDRGLTQNVERSVLEKRYGGEALVPTKALTQNAAIVADDAVREVKLPSLDAEVPQQFTLRNTGATPITLQLEYPLLGVTESKLSRDVIAPGETATLDLKVKWRSIFKAPYQNVLVSIATNDPIVPRLQLAVLLTPPQDVGQ